MGVLPRTPATCGNSRARTGVCKFFEYHVRLGADHQDQIGEVDEEQQNNEARESTVNSGAI